MEKADEIGVMPQEESMIVYPTDSYKKIAKMIVERFKVGDFIIIEGTEAFEFRRFIDAPNFPEWMELRIRKVNKFTWCIFYPKGLLIWWELQHILSVEMLPIKLKNIIGDTKGVLHYKIWRAE